MADEKLYALCKFYGSRALEARRKFLGLLPEVFKRKLYEKHHCSSIYEFAAKLAGVSKEQVDRVLQLDKRFENMPALKSALTSGEVSVNKIVRVASIATVENQEELAERLKVLPKAGVEVMVKDMKNQIGLFERKTEANSVPGHSFEFSEEVTKKLLELQQKGIDLNKLLLEFLQKREEQIAEAKEEVVVAETESKYINVSIQKILQLEYGRKCAVPGCNKLATEIHHSLPFSVSHSHDPKFLIPLCKGHHQEIHLVNEQYKEIVRKT